MKGYSLLPLALFSAALTLPAVALADYHTEAANMGTIIPADARTTPAPNTLQKKIYGPNGELLATQPGEVDMQTTDTNRNHTATNGQSTPLNQLHRSPDYRPLIQSEVNRGKVTPAQLRNQSAPITLQQKIKGPHGELLATQPGEFQIQESRRFIAR